MHSRGSCPVASQEPIPEEDHGDIRPEVEESDGGTPFSTNFLESKVVIRCSAEGAMEERRRITREQARGEIGLRRITSAVEDMQVAARIISDTGDVGLTLQRLQEEIIRKLDDVIDRPSPTSEFIIEFSTAAATQQQQQQPEVPNQPQPRQEQQQQQQQQQESGSGGDQQPPGREEADLQSVFEESSVEWGALPRRFRDMIRQGLRESMSRSYRRMTEDYYRKIAEEASE